MEVRSIKDMFESIEEARVERFSIMQESNVPNAVESAADDLHKCEATLKSLCGDRGFLDLRIRPLREPGSSVDSSTHRLLQLQCKPRAAQ